MAALTVLLGRRRRSRALSARARVSLVLLPDHLALQRRQLSTVVENLSDQRTLCGDNAVLFDYQEGQQSVRNEEHNRQQRQQTMLRFDWEIRVSDERQGAPRGLP